MLLLHRSLIAVDFALRSMIQQSQRTPASQAHIIYMLASAYIQKASTHHMGPARQSEQLRETDLECVALGKHLPVLQLLQLCSPRSMVEHKSHHGNKADGGNCR